MHISRLPLAGSKIISRWLQSCLLPIVMTLLATAPHIYGDDASLHLTASTPITIVLPSQPTLAERTAGNEAATYLGKVLGRSIEVVKADTLPEGFPIVIGWHPSNKFLSLESLETEESVVDITRQKISLAGGRVWGEDKNAPLHDRGTLYAVYDFLERVGIRWYRPDALGEFVPKLETIDLPMGNTRTIPKFKYRYGANTRFTFGPHSPEDIEMMRIWLVRNRANTNTWVGPEWGGYYQQDFAHSYNAHLPHGQHFASHPEYYALINGQRSSDPNAQLCLGNPEVQELVAQSVIRMALSDPRIETVSLDPNDGALWCECDLCRAMDDPNQKSTASGTVSKANRVCKFNNIVARKLADVAPEKKVGWYVYNEHTEIPSQVHEMEPNTVVQIAPFAGAFSDYSRKLYDPTSTQNLRINEIIKGYARMMPVQMREYWSYYIWPGPLPLIQTMTDRLRHYAKDYGVTGVSNEQHPCWGTQTDILYMYLWLMQNPDRDVRAEMDLFYSNYYGPAAGPMKSYHELLEKSAQEGPYFGSGGSRIEALFTPWLIAKMSNHVEEAARLVQGREPYESRLQGAIAGLTYTKLTREFLDQVTQGKLTYAKKTLAELKLFFLEQGKLGNFDNYITQDLIDHHFTEYDRQLGKGSALTQFFVSPQVVQVHEKGWRFFPGPQPETKVIQEQFETRNGVFWPLENLGRSKGLVITVESLGIENPSLPPQWTENESFSILVPSMAAPGSSSTAGKLENIYSGQNTKATTNLSILMSLICSKKGRIS